METQLTKDIKRRLHYFRPAMNSSMRTIRWAEEVKTATGFVDVIRFEDYIANNKSYCSRKEPATENPLPCKIPGNVFPCKECTGCVFHKHVYELGILTTCFEVKITVSDFKSKNGHNFSGNKNYYAVPVEIYESIKDDVPPGIGIITYYQDSGHMIVKRESEMRQIAPEELNYLLYDALKKWVDEAPGHERFYEIQSEGTEPPEEYAVFIARIEESLKPCPYCGGKGRVTTDGGGFRICCKKCFASTRLSIDEETAVDTWNKRMKEENENASCSL